MLQNPTMGQGQDQILTMGRRTFAFAFARHLHLHVNDIVCYLGWVEREHDDHIPLKVEMFDGNQAHEVKPMRESATASC